MNNQVIIGLFGRKITICCIACDISNLIRVRVGLVDEIRQATNGNFVFGNDRFKEEISKTLGKRVTPRKAE